MNDSARNPGKGARRFTFRKAVDEWAFAQYDLVDHDKLASLAKDRGIGFSRGGARELLEQRDKVGALRPLAYQRGGYGGELVFREEVEFVPWDDYTVVVDGMPRMRALYTPWQLLYAKDAYDLGSHSVSIEWLLDAKKRRLGAGWRPFLEDRLERWRGLDDYWRIVMLMLVRLQNRYLASVRGTLTTSSWRVPFNPKTRQRFDTDAAVRDFEPEEALRELGLTVREVANVHHRLITAHAFDDPLDNWHMLVRMTPYKQRQRLQGDALRAQDTFDAAEIVRHFYFDLTGDLLPQPDEVFDGSGGGWRNRVYGHGPQLMHTREDLKKELQRFGLYPHLVHLIVEGPTEMALFEHFFEALGLDAARHGITFSTFDGVGQHRLRRAILNIARTYTQFPVLISDREGDIEREVDALQKEGLLHPDSTFLWNKSLEEDNFTCEELVELARAIATKHGVPLKLAGSTLRRRYRERHRQTGIGLGEVLLDLAANPRHGSVRISKQELGTEMATFLWNECNAPGQTIESVADRRPVIRILLNILRVT